MHMLPVGAFKDHKRRAVTWSFLRQQRVYTSSNLCNPLI